MANEPDLMNPPAGSASDTVAIPNDAPEAKIPDVPGAPAPEGGLSPETPIPPEGEAPAPAEGAPAPGGEEPVSEGALPTDQSQWEQTTIVEGLGTPDEHQDQFWRNGNFGIELDQTGVYEAYAIVDNTPVMLEGTYESFEEAVAGINGEMNHKSLGGESAPMGDPGALDGPAEEAAPAESAEEAPAETSGEAPPESGDDSPQPKEDKPAPKEDKPAPKEDKKEDGSKDKKDDKKEEKTKPSKKSVSGVEDTDSIRSMIGAYWHTKTTGVNNLPHTSRSLRDVAKSQNRTAAVGGVTVRIGCDRDAIDMTPGKPNRNDGSYKHVDPSVRNAMAPPKSKSVKTKATSVDDMYDENNLGHAKTGVTPAQDVY